MALPPADPRVLHGDCLEVVPAELPPNSVNLIVTSPPYADQRARHYLSVHPDRYVDWFLPRAAVLRNALASDGSFCLNIKEKVVNGERHRYVMDLVLALRETQAWRLVDQYIWHKRSTTPGKWPNRFRDAWEHVFHFTKSPKFKMRQEAVRVPVGDWRATFTGRSRRHALRDPSATGSGFAVRRDRWLAKDAVLPSNVLHLAAECQNKNHPAVFPPGLPRFFIRLFSDPGDVVLDPFCGSGTTLLVAADLGRAAVGIDASKPYCDGLRGRLAQREGASPRLFNQE